jgi:hypothetical protein
MQSVFMWIAAAVAVTAVVSGSSDAVALAHTAMKVTGVTAGAIVGGAPDLINGFKDAKADTVKAPAGKTSSNPAG